MYLAVIDNKQEEHFDFIVGNYEFYKENMLKNLAVDLKNFLNKLGNAE